MKLNPDGKHMDQSGFPSQDNPYNPSDHPRNMRQNKVKYNAFILDIDTGLVSAFPKL